MPENLGEATAEVFLRVKYAIEFIESDARIAVMQNNWKQNVVL